MTINPPSLLILSNERECYDCVCSICVHELLKFPLSNPKLILFTDKTYYKSVEKEMATHSSILAWEITWTEETSGLYGPWGHKSQTRLSV